MNQIQLTIEQDRFFLRFSWDPELVARIKKELPAAQFSKPYKAWTLPLTHRAYHQLINMLGPSARRPEIERQLAEQRKSILLSHWKFKTEPMTHQLDAIKFMLEQFGVEVKP